MSKEKWILEYAIKRGWAKIGGVHWEMAEEAYYTHLHGKLLPCPFCGDIPNLLANRRFDEHYVRTFERVEVCCTNCSVTLVYEGEDRDRCAESAINTWNNRV